MSETPAPDKLPLWRNIRWFQLIFGAIAGVATWDLFRHFRGIAPLTQGGLAGRVVLLVVGLFAFVVYLQNVYRFGLIPDYALKCRFCNGPVNRYSEFCEHCGADLIADEKLVPCPKCGVDLYPDTKHCPECGALVASKKGKGKKSRNQDPPPPEAGWETPLGADNPAPWEDRR